MKEMLEIVINKYMTEEQLQKLIQDQPQLIKFINNPSEAVQLIALRRASYTFSLIKNPTEAAQFLLLRKGGMLLYSIY